MLAQLLGDAEPDGWRIVRSTWKAKGQSDDQFEVMWRTMVHNGVLAKSSAATKTVSFKANLAALEKPKRPSAGYEIVFRLDPTVHDGRFANNGWLQELPKPLSKLTWSNAAHMSPKTAEKLGVTDEDVVSLSLDGRKIELPVWRQPGCAENSVTIHFGHGRTQAGRVGDGSGASAYKLWTSSIGWHAPGLEISRTGAKELLANTQTHRSMEGRELVRSASTSEFEKNPKFAQLEPDPGPELTLYHDDHVHEGYAWGMSIDLNRCIGCSACVLACQAENNIPVVGKEQVIVGREMHWIDLDCYYEGDPNDPEYYHMPRMCMHCENAPCEVVCPVEATVHDNEGLNNMVYNRCVGTRYCGNNCPYKVRHFNFLQYADLSTPSLKLLSNPDVTVRARGVMEKCSYCVQRINQARYTAELDDRKIKDGDIVTACQAACPAQAIVFGDIRDPNSKVSTAKADPRSYGILTELNTRPRTTYIARLTNPNPALAKEVSHGD